MAEIDEKELNGWIETVTESLCNAAGFDLSYWIRRSALRDALNHLTESEIADSIDRLSEKIRRGQIIQKEKYKGQAIVDYHCGILKNMIKEKND